MQTTKRKPASFRLPAFLIEGLKEEAKKNKRSLNNYVEVILLEALNHKPNETTLAAMAECESGTVLPKVDTSNIDAFIKSIEE